MTILSHTPIAPREHDLLVIEKLNFWPSIAIGFCVALLFCLPTISPLWGSGIIHDPDDAMRLVLLHQWMNGHNWYDETLMRLDPPYGTWMHWSHVIDLPLALLYKIFILFTDHAHAELLMRISYPLLLQLGVLICGVIVSDLLYGPRARLISALALVFSGSFMIQFSLGRVDHHSMQILLLGLLCASTLLYIRRESARAAALCGLIICLSLAISVENMPFIIVICASLPVIWALQGTHRKGLRVFGLSLMLSAPCVFMLFYDPAHWFELHADAMSPAHVGALMSGGLICILLSLYSASQRTSRFYVLAIGASAWLIFSALCFPILFGDPYNGLDPLVRHYWLDHVKEVRNIFQLYASDGPISFGFYIPLILCELILLRIGVTQRRADFIILTALLGVGIITQSILIRAFGFTTLLCAFGTPAIAQFLSSSLNAFPLPSASARLWGGFCALLLCSPIFWIGLISPAPNEKADAQTSSSLDICFEQNAYASLAKLPKGRVLNFHQLGSHILLYTYHDVMAAPYHRNNHGNRLSLDIFAAASDEGHALLKEYDINYIALCTSDGAISGLTHDYPKGLMALLVNHVSLPFLQPVDMDGPIQIWRIK